MDDAVSESALIEDTALSWSVPATAALAGQARARLSGRPVKVVPSKATGCPAI